MHGSNWGRRKVLCGTNVQHGGPHRLASEIAIHPNSDVSDRHVCVCCRLRQGSVKNWCVPVEALTPLDAYIDDQRTWSEWEILFREIRERAANGIVLPSYELATVFRLPNGWANTLA